MDVIESVDECIGNQVEHVKVRLLFRLLVGIGTNSNMLNLDFCSNSSLHRERARQIRIAFYAFPCCHIKCTADQLACLYQN